MGFLEKIYKPSKKRNSRPVVSLTDIQIPSVATNPPPLYTSPPTIPQFIPEQTLSDSLYPKQPLPDFSYNTASNKLFTKIDSGYVVPLDDVRVDLLEDPGPPTMYPIDTAKVSLTDVSLNSDTSYSDYLSSCLSPKTVIKVTGQKSNSSSSSDVIILTMDNGEDLVLKIFSPKNHSLLYESRVYEHIHHNMRFKSFNLARYIARSENCTLEHLQNIIGGINEDNEIKLIVNLIYILCRFRNRPSVTENTLDYAKSLFGFSNSCPDENIKLLLNRPYNEYGWDLLKNYMNTYHRFGFTASFRMKSIPLSLYVQRSVQHLHAYLFQILYTIYMLNANDINHNDLHAANIILDDWRDDEMDRFYVHNAQTYIVDTPYVPRIFDWDMAFVPSLGPNSRLNNRTDGTNTFVSKYRDMLRFICSISYYTDNSYYDSVSLFMKYLKIIAFKPEHMHYMNTVFKHEHNPVDKQNIPPCVFVESKMLLDENLLAGIMYPPHTIVERAGEYLKGNPIYWKQAIKMNIDRLKRPIIYKF